MIGCGSASDNPAFESCAWSVHTAGMASEPVATPDEIALVRFAMDAVGEDPSEYPQRLYDHAPDEQARLLIESYKAQRELDAADVSSVAHLRVVSAEHAQIPYTVTHCEGTPDEVVMSGERLGFRVVLADGYEHVFYGADAVEELRTSADWHVIAAARAWRDWHGANQPGL